MIKQLVQKHTICEANYELGEISRACNDLSLVKASGYLGNTMVYENLCLNN